MAKTEYRNAASHPVDLASGQMVEPGGKAKADPTDEHDKQLIEAGLLVEVETPHKRSSGEGGKEGSK